MSTYAVVCRWDAEARVWYVADSDVPGLATEAATLHELREKLRHLVPELVKLNEGARHQD